MRGLEEIKNQMRSDKMRCGNFEWEVNYFDSDGKVNVDLFSDIAENITFRCIKFLTPNDRENKRRISLNQIRKFYDEILSFQTQIENSKDKKEKFRELLPYIKMQKAKVNLAYNKKNVNTNFKNFIEKNIDYIIDGYDKDLEGSLKKFNIFVSLFEAVIAYSKGVILEN